MPMTQDEMVKLLKKNGFEVVKGGKGSHIKMTKPRTEKTYYHSTWRTPKGY